MGDGSYHFPTRFVVLILSLLLAALFGRCKGTYLMSGTRITVRLDHERKALLESLCQQIGCDASQIVRQALDRFATSPTPPTPNPRSTLSTCSGSQDAASDHSDPATATTCQPRSTEPVRLDGMLASRAAVGPPFSERVRELLPYFRACGMAIWPERRNLFQRLVAAAEVACESGEDPRDSRLLMELLRLGNEYKQL